ncbi:MAG TPA: type II secretion system F family protein [Rhizomicrobium sp.]|jgi:tight adherence protein B|nr:type II secretion system F family protein [Rhizomicrobium sp.]
MGTVTYVITAAFLLLGLGGIAYMFVAPSGETSKRRLAAVAGGPSVSGAGRASQDSTAQRRKNVTALLKDLEKQQAAKKQRPTMRRRLEQAGLDITPQTFWIASGIATLVAVAVSVVMRQSLIIDALAAFVIGIGLPRWVLAFLRSRRQKKFTLEFANAIDTIVRSIRSGLPTTEALKIVARESPDPVGSEFHKLVESLKVGVTLEQALKRMFDAMPTAEVSFFGIVMTIQAKSGGNLSEALSNLSGVLRDRKRLRGKIKAMSSEAKASAMIIGALPIAVMGLVYFTTPEYIKMLFTERMGNIMLAGCVIWMGMGIAVMKKMISFKH